MNAAPKSLYFVNAGFDFVFVGALSCVVYAALAVIGKSEWSAPASFLALYLSWIVNWPHFSATIYRLFSAKENSAQYPVTSFVIPVLVGLGVVGAFTLPEIVAPFFVKLFMFWSPYHFSGQSVGITLVYSRRAGVVIPQWARYALSAFVFSTYALPTARAEVGTQGADYYGIHYPPLGIPEWVPKIFEALMITGGVVFAAFAIYWTVKNRKLLPPILLMPAIAQFVWFIAGANLATFYVFVPFFHSLQYLPLAWVVQLGSKMKEKSFTPSRRFMWQETAAWFGANLIGGALLFWGLPQIAALFGAPLTFATGILLAAIQIHHFFVDGVIWKLKNNTVVSPLLLNVRHFTAQTQSTQRQAA